MNGGLCNDLINSFRCVCPIGYTGPRCETNIDDCLSSPCRNGGVCRDSVAGYTCECPPGFTGISCETNINDCQSSPCQRGECIDGENSFTCLCHPGFTGYLCQTQIDECQSDPCHYGGHCEDLINGYQCRCKPGTQGPNCEININECVSNPCRNGAKCIDGINRYSCECLPGFMGIHCETNINECASNPCANGGNCIDLINGFRCQCPKGYFDARCLSDFDECASAPCFNGGTCEDGVNQFNCRCPPGYGGRRCQYDLDECGSNPCQHGGQCVDKLGSYKCNCQPGFEGVNCEINVDDCQRNPCKGHGSTCIDLVNDYKCICELPNTGRNCESKMDPCSPNKPSVNFLDFACACELGWTGRLCEEDVNECVGNAPPCRNGATCRNTDGGYMCECARGYEGKDCLNNTDDCALNPCQNGGTCLDGIGEYTCLCVDGFGGYDCSQDIDECLSSPCRNGATCRQYVNSYTCTCPLGFSGPSCETNDQDCTDSSCMNGGRCIDGINNYTCICPPGYTGSNCQTRINECDAQPCLNGATCQQTHLQTTVRSRGALMRPAPAPPGQGYSCHCPYGFAGSRCEAVVDWCSTKPCMNQAKCRQTDHTFSCSCAPGWTGKLCDVEMVSCEAAATRKGMSVESLCNNGTCENIGNSHRCQCLDGFAGSYCQEEGQNCELNINECQPNPCQNGGLCHDLVNGFSCSCPPGTLGIICDINLDDCVPGACHNGGNCTDKVNGFECKCPPGFVGPRCEGDINNYHCSCRPGYMGRHCESKVNFCESSPCQNGGACTSTASEYSSALYPSTRYSTRSMILPPTGHKCICVDGYYGKNCEFSGHVCDSSPCQNSGQCRADRSSERGYICECMPGTSGALCEVDSRDECASNPCRGNDAICQDRLGDYVCFCPPKWNGKSCDIFDPNFIGGMGRITPSSSPSNRPHITEQERESCIQRNCERKAGDRRCDEECNSYACSFDGGDCSLGLNPWKNCSAGIACWDVFKNGECNSECNNAQCLFDGHDCEKKLEPCNPIYDGYCQTHYANGHCDYGCNNEECGWDGMDCEDKPAYIADGLISVVLLMDHSTFKQHRVAFVREIGHQLRTTIRIKQDSNGNDMIYPWSPAYNNLPNVQSGIPQSGIFRPDTSNSFQFKYNDITNGIIVYLELDNRKCSQVEGNECFFHASDAAYYLGASAISHALPKDFPIFQVQGHSAEPPTPGDEPGVNAKFVLVGVVLTLIIGLLLFVLVNTQRKRAHGVTWFPEGFLRNNSGQRRRSHRRGPDGQEMRNLNKQASSNCLDFDMAMGGMPPNMTQNQGPHWSDDDESDLPPPKRMRGPGDVSNNIGYSSDHTNITEYEEPEPRVWTQHHLDAADISRRPDINSSILTPPSIEGDIDVRGPLGMTPLMVAAVRGGGNAAGTGIDTGITLVENEEEEDQTGQVIAELVAQGAELNAAMDKTGETSLHLAARYARADAAKRLLDAGADANSQDNTGRTPLHAAVAADAMGVFQILLRNRATNLNAKMHDGTSPLILAARLAIEGMVEDLINADADINAADNAGKTALHWAAAVNNVDAVNILLAHGANRDAQDEKDETPLFLAAREGSFEACRTLLDNFANREITDHMDRLPRDVAQERLHHDIVRLLDEHIPRSPQMIAVMPNAAAMGGLGSPTLLSHPTVISSKNRGSKKRATKSPTSPDAVQEQPPRRKASTKKKKQPEPRSVESATSSLSPVGSLESPHNVTETPSPYDPVLLILLL
ncbi:hypothetical protein B566_EDAN016082 [Ephemera danica]|nr:hypothetical protein B566_EDAN016082 [Ephemera danica]